MKRNRGQTKLDVYLICRLVYLLCRLLSLWLCLVYFGDILKYRLDPELDFGFWEKKITLESPSSRHLLKFCRKTTKVSSWRQMFEKLRRVKFLAITLSLKDIELGLKIPMESFPWLIYNRLLVENMLREVKRPHSFKYGTRFSAVYEKGQWSI